MRNLESVQENETHKILWNFEIETDHLVLTRRPNLVTVNKKENLPNRVLFVPADHNIKLKESAKTE